MTLKTGWDRWSFGVSFGESNWPTRRNLDSRFPLLFIEFSRDTNETRLRIGCICPVENRDDTRSVLSVFPLREEEEEEEEVARGKEREKVVRGYLERKDDNFWVEIRKGKEKKERNRDYKWW